MGGETQLQKGKPTNTKQPERKPDCRKEFAGTEPLKEPPFLVKTGEERIPLHGNPKEGSNCFEAFTEVCLENEIILNTKKDEKQKATIVLSMRLKDGRTIGNGQFYIITEDGKEVIPVLRHGENAIVGLTLENIIFRKGMRIVFKEEKQNGDFCAGNMNVTTEGIRVMEWQPFDPSTGKVNSKYEEFPEEKIYFVDDLPPQYFQPLTSVEPRGFDSQAGFVPGAALVQNFSSRRLMELLRVEPLKQECNGELEVILYYNGIGTRGIEWNPARVEAPVSPSAERREFVAASGNEVAVQECRVDAAPAAQQAPMQFAYDSFEPAPARFKKEKRAREKPVETKSAAWVEKANERKCKNPVRKERAEVRPSVKRAADETPFWRIDSKGRMKPMHAPRGMDDGAPAPIPELKVGVPKLMGKLVFGREKISPAKLSVVEKAKDPMPLREKKKKRRRRPEMKQVGAEKPAEKPKRPAAKVRFGDAVPLSSGITRKKVRREMPAVELKKEKKAKRRAEKKMGIALGQDAAVSTKRKARRKEKAVMLDTEGKKRSRREERKRARKRQTDTVEYMVMGKKKRGKRRYWAPLSLR